MEERIFSDTLSSSPCDQSVVIRVVEQAIGLTIALRASTDEELRLLRERYLPMLSLPHLHALQGLLATNVNSLTRMAA